MKMTLERFRSIDKNRIRNFLRFRVPTLRYMSKEKLSYGLFFTGLAISCLSSIHISYTWPIESVYQLVCAPFFILAILLSHNISKPIFKDKSFLIPALLCIAVQIYMCIVNKRNPSEYILSSANFFLAASLFMTDKSTTNRLSTMFCKTLSSFLVVSLAAYFMYIVGFPLPGHSIVYGNYSYTNHLLFLLDDRSLWDLVLPRFHSIFLEPGHLGTVVVMLLASQIGNWKKWYNIVLFISLFLSFSLAAYGLLVILLFLRLWMLGQKIIVKLAILVCSITIVVGGSYIYNDGNNLLNQLIVSRLEMNDAGDDIEGNNRVSSDFERDFESFLQSDDIFFGKEMDMTIWGNSGYRVFIYDYGFVGTILFLIFYYFAFRTGKYPRAIISAFILAMANFWIRGYPIHNIFWVLYFLIAHQNLSLQMPEENNSKTKNE